MLATPYPLHYIGAEGLTSCIPTVSAQQLDHALMSKCPIVVECFALCMKGWDEQRNATDMPLYKATHDRPNDFSWEVLH